ncbi:hypothetical protein RRF57_007319 [Xylaria bambusicola]|uniref:Helicase ATP-binding domain-containing protein n=1 Tax=Xylaria bambusicola TaxID=326684 RepID=A0AAN7UG01_9PEZI
MPKKTLMRSGFCGFCPVLELRLNGKAETDQVEAKKNMLAKFAAWLTRNAPWSLPGSALYWTDTALPSRTHDTCAYQEEDTSHGRETFTEEPVSSLEIIQVRNSVYSCISSVINNEHTLNDSNTSTTPTVKNEPTCFGTYPIYTTRNVPYLNPQRFHNETNVYTSKFWSTSRSQGSREEEMSPIDFLATFTSDGVLNETEGSEFLQTPLISHQKKALTFMLNREQGWNFEQDGTDIWTSKWDQDSRYKYFVNNVDSTEYSDLPPPFKGGILADGMGFGKSLSMISLIAHDRSNGPRGTPSNYFICPPRCTLVVMPPHVLETWDKELSNKSIPKMHADRLRHLSNRHFSWHRHHRSTKIKNESSFLNTDIVLITYSTLASEWRHKSSSVIYRQVWYRVILDEAHSIKDPTTAAAKAAFALKSDRRWVVTGTPIQNRLSELASLFRFLQAFPYSNPKAFDECITRVGLPAIERLKRLLNYTMLRRPQNILDLPRRTDLKVFLKFDDPEQIAYNTARDKTTRSLDDLITSDQAGESYFNALQKINSLRLICNLGVSAIEDSRLSPSPSLLPRTTVWDKSKAQQALISLYLAGVPLACVTCGIAIDTYFSIPPDLGWLQVSKCLEIQCPSCHNSSPASEMQSCPCNSNCSSVSVRFQSLLVSIPDTRQLSRNLKFPTKIRRLVHDIEQHSSKEKCIVFSYWKTTLDLAFNALKEAGISCVQREQTFHDFTHVESVRVLLLSLSCGSSGLTLTSASRVFLMEPQWNPSTEEQAMGRFYHIGQMRDVTTVRYIMDHSIEKHVLAVQDRKKDLITFLLSSPGATSTKMTKQRLMVRLLLSKR